MRRANFVVVILSGLVLSGLVLGEAPALAADSGPVIVLPGRHGLPVIINGVDVTGAVLEGDWGLYSPHMVGPTIIPAPWIPGRSRTGSYYRGRYVEDGYFPAFGHAARLRPPRDRAAPRPAAAAAGAELPSFMVEPIRSGAGEPRSAGPVAVDRSAADLSGRAPWRRSTAEKAMIPG